MTAKGFPTFDLEDYVLEDRYCYYCGGEYNHINKTLSTPQTLHVRCQNEHRCNGYTVAFPIVLLSLPAPEKEV